MRWGRLATIEHMFVEATGHEIGGGGGESPASAGRVAVVPGREPIPLADMSTDAVADLLSSLTALRSQVEAGMATVVAELREREMWGGTGFRSPAHYLSVKAGLVPNECHRLLDVARVIDGDNKLGSALASGEISLGQAAAVAKVAGEKIDEMVELAGNLSGGQLVKVCRTLRQAKREQEKHEDYPPRTERQPRFTWAYDDDRRLKGRLELSSAEGADLISALGPRATAIMTQARADGVEMPFGAAHAMALIDLVRRGVEPARAAGDLEGRTEIVAHVDADALAGLAEGRAFVEGGAAISQAELSEMCCGGDIVAVAMRNGKPLAVGRARRDPTLAQRRAISARDEGMCRWPGCGSGLRTHIHHIEWWSEGGRTDLDNLVTLCTFHHREVHKGTFRLSMADDGSLQIDKMAVGQRVPLGAQPEIPSPELARSGWFGERMNRWALGVILESLLRPKRMAAA